MPARAFRDIAVVALWTLALLAAGILSAVRFHATVVDPTSGIDLHVFLTAAQQVASGGDPYDAKDYVYSPLLAVLLAPFSGSTLTRVIPAWTAISIAASIGTVAVVLALVWSRIGRVMRPTLALVGVVTTLWSYPATFVLWFGQVDFIVSLIIAVSVASGVAGRAAWSGVMAGVAAAAKSWPGAEVLWYLRRGAQGRRRSLVGFVVVVAAVAVLTCVGLGTSALREWIAVTVGARSQPLSSFSAWGVGRDLFSDSGVLATPVAVSPAMRLGATLVVTAGVVALLVLAMRRPGDAALAAWNILGCVLLLMPVSHLTYRVYLLPMIWLWLVQRDRLPRAEWLTALGIVGVSWLVGYRTATGDPGHVTVGPFVTVLAANLLMVTASVIGASRMVDMRCSDTRVSSDGAGRVG
ncbi:glycosyltransferase family 87 protein [Luteimicrobium subarcticum]|uniref:Uncharacterized protein DUF2029 n=1 Tax=Luteimicrobium subarcticum TaxID=620910 RepID=A0A2M8WT38_9MICO|nr:glycosyltransferase family 87 protein [Luteimicrobium subarcticum]PJI94093.1 uncharacterized protein DUF2029 [Luteimicrobium subarcticum]